MNSGSGTGKPIEVVVPGRMETLKRYIDVDAVVAEVLTLLILPAIATALWKIAGMMDVNNPYVGPFLLMVVLAFSSLNFIANGLKTRLLVDAVVVLATIQYGQTNYPLEGPPKPDSDIVPTLIGTICIIATVRTLILSLLMGERKIASANS